MFREFWVEKPTPDAKTLTLYALLDSSLPAAGARYRIQITPGAETITLVHEVVYCRNNPAVLGLAPLTSMFWHWQELRRQLQ